MEEAAPYRKRKVHSKPNQIYSGKQIVLSIDIGHTTILFIYSFILLKTIVFRQINGRFQ